MPKSWMKSKGIQGGSIALFTSLIISITPRVSNIIKSYVPEYASRKKANIEEVEAIFIELLSFIGAGGASYGIVGRMVAKGPLVEMDDSHSSDDVDPDHKADISNRHSLDKDISSHSEEFENPISQDFQREHSPRKSFASMFG